MLHSLHKPYLAALLAFVSLLGVGASFVYWQQHQEACACAAFQAHQKRTLCQLEIQRLQSALTRLKAQDPAQPDAPTPTTPEDLKDLIEALAQQTGLRHTLLQDLPLSTLSTSSVSLEGSSSVASDLEAFRFWRALQRAVPSGIYLQHWEIRKKTERLDGPREMQFIFRILWTPLHHKEEA